MDAGDLLMVLFTAAATACVVGIALGRQARVPDEAADAGEGRLRGQLESMTAELARMRDVVAVFERDRAAQYGELSGHIAAAGQRTAELAETTRELRQALSSSKARGQWGERMAEDVLRLAGLLEGVNYRRQTTVEGGRSIPDFTFLLPRGLQLHMDVKFPLDNYLHYLSAETDSERAAHKAQFLRDVRARVRELNGRGYIDPETTVDCMLLFIPNEQLYAF
ncbi:MAG TPA: DNA recombination protein RmuC, partial [Egibacteraceae bacterium]|nr:DNA recombination protein RmuC [Egibacteraceae bacterium]